MARLLSAALIALFLAVPGHLGARDSRAESPAQYRDVSLVQLIANPERFDGTRVRVVGFCWLEFEGNAIYLHREDCEHRIVNNAVWLQLGWPVAERYASVSGKYVLVQGVFSAQHRGHMGVFAGSMDEISRLDVWKSRQSAD
jgi:hypothetical protein